MVVLPYQDRLEVFSKYLQQLVMESLGKEKDREGVSFSLLGLFLCLINPSIKAPFRPGLDFTTPTDDLSVSDHPWR